MKASSSRSRAPATSLLAVMVALAGCTNPPGGSPTAPPAGGASAAPSMASLDEMSLDELHQLALEEGGIVNWYATINERDSGLLQDAFTERFPGMLINHVHLLSEDLVPRAVAEARGGRILADAFQVNALRTSLLRDEGLLEDYVPPEAAVWAQELKGDYWFAVILEAYVIAWNTDRVSDAEAPKTYEDLTDPKWNGLLISDSTDVRILLGLARHKFDSDEEATTWLEAVAANNVKFHSGASNMRALIESGQEAICFSCLAVHFPPIIEAGAPVNFSLEESVGDLSVHSVSQGGPHPISTRLFTRWMAAADGAQSTVWAVNSNPAHPDVEPQRAIGPKITYPILIEDLEFFSKYEDIWNEIFGLRG